METETRISSAISRRTLITGSAGWVVGTAGLLLPGSMDEAEAREGVLGGKKGGRHGKDHRGRDKHRGNDDNDKRDEARDQDILGLKNAWIEFHNASTYANLQVAITGPENIPLKYVSPGDYSVYRSKDTWVRADIGISGVVHILASNDLITEPFVTISDNQGQKTSVYLSVNQSFDFVEKSGGATYNIKRESDAHWVDEDYKLFSITARD